jgi:hypothetical protein
MNYTVYDPTTGEIQYVFASENSDLTEQNLAGKTYIAGNYNSRDHYIDSGSVVDKPTAPSIPGLVYQFDYATKTWQINLFLSEQASRQLRNSQLTQVDKINPIWYASLSPEQQAELIVYRQALLAVPQQSGFPAQVEWPAKPAWI